MQKTICMLFIIVSFFSIGSYISSPEDTVSVIIIISCIMIICILQVTKNIIKKNTKILTILQVIICLLGLYYKIDKIMYLLPILIFELFKDKINISMSILVAIAINSIFIRVDIFNIFLYIVIINLYLFELNKKHISDLELKESNRGERYENFKMKEKINNLEKYLEQNSIMTSLRERNFMAQKLHDHLGHRITSSLMQLEVTKETLGNDNEVSKKYLISAMSNLREGMEEIREVLRNVKPREKVLTLEDIKEHLLKFQYSSGIKTSLKVEGDLEKIKLNIWIIIEENLKEALTNALKYSKATEVTVSILIYNKILRVEIKDNGIGSNFKGDGLGLRGIKERMEAVNGRLEYFNDNGFTINMIFNLGD